MLAFLLELVAIKAPISWSKFRSGWDLSFMGYQLNTVAYEVGLAAGRADWVQD